MAYEILSESYGARLPKITATADSTDDLATMGTNYAEGSTCVIGDKTYTLDKVQGWVEPGSGGGGSGGGLVEEFTWQRISALDIKAVSADSAEDIFDAFKSGRNVAFHIPHLDGHLAEGYLSITGIAFATDSTGSTSDIISSMYGDSGSGITAVLPEGYNSGYCSLNGFSTFSVDENGKLVLQLAVD